MVAKDWPLVAVALKRRSFLELPETREWVPFRKPEEVKESRPPRWRGRATEPFGAFCLKNSLEAAEAED